MTQKTQHEEDKAPEDPAGPPTWETEIKGFFTQMDIGCMRSVSGLDLASYEDVKDRAESILRWVADGRMPKGGRQWSPEKVERFKQWMADKCPEAPSTEGGKKEAT